MAGSRAAPEMPQHREQQDEQSNNCQTKHLLMIFLHGSILANWLFRHAGDAAFRWLEMLPHSGPYKSV